ncbi:hypothetical protein [Streptomyces guryensis]|uniref:Uncharacterized protein n=1 Tax=Streptomyces guryensis TaxID=2886947 RepID=A0A9Q3VXQ9_9ACTN|nr:hypothetical protein [Streptomyces guryensis]MCD9878890.1 hypothetical protein [Streptomyces guryensis]
MTSHNDSEVWDPFGTLHRALWIGGGQWAGKSTVARLLAVQYGVTVYHYDYHDAHGHNDRRIARRVALGEPTTEPDMDEAWVHTAPEEMAAQTLAGPNSSRPSSTHRGRKRPARYGWGGVVTLPPRAEPPRGWPADAAA